MLQSLPGFLQNYWMYLAAVAVGGIVLCYFSEKLRGYLIKGLLVFAVLFGLAAGYELVTGRSLFSLPGRIDNKLSEGPAQVESGRRYYKSYEERFGEKPPSENPPGNR